MTTGNLRFYTFKALQPVPTSPSTQAISPQQFPQSHTNFTDLPFQRTSEHYLFKPLDKGCHLCIL